jgi:glycosyltransferase involved in cell wall biosynthesis
MRDDLARHGFDDRMAVWGRGVDTELFTPNGKTANNLSAPVFLYVGRVAVEKNIEAFLKLELPGVQLVVGDGPSRRALEKRYPRARFVGYRFGAELAQYFSSADVFVFPSRTDTFGLVMLEAMACGTPVAAFPVPGPIDVVTQGVTGFLDNDLQSAALNALRLDRAACRDFALSRGWRACAQTMRDNLALARNRTTEHTESFD